MTDGRRQVKARGRVFLEIPKDEVRKGDLVDYVEGTVSKHRRFHFVEKGLQRRKDGEARKGSTNIVVRLHRHEGTTRNVDIRSVIWAYRWRGAEDGTAPDDSRETPEEGPSVEGRSLPPMTPLQERAHAMALENGSTEGMTHGEYCAVVQLHKMGVLVLDRKTKRVSPPPPEVPDGEE